MENNVYKGAYIALEGGEGSGKSTISVLIREYLNRLKHEVVNVREPGGTPFAEEVRAIVLNNRNEGDDPSALTEGFIMNAARRDLLEKRVIPALEKGLTVFSDRCYLSTLVYQCHAGSVDLLAMKPIIDIATSGAKPNAIIVLDIDPKIGLQRSFNAESTGTETRMEEKGLIFHQKVRQGYLTEAATNDNIFIIDANQKVKNVFSDIIKVLNEQKIINIGDVEVSTQLFWNEAVSKAEQELYLRKNHAEHKCYDTFTLLIIDLIEKNLF